VLKIVSVLDVPNILELKLDFIKEPKVHDLRGND